MCRNRRAASSRATELGREYSLRVQCLGCLQIVVSGVSTGIFHRFSPLQSVQNVNHRDALYLLESGLFGVCL
jgi:hypothetical protein